MNTQYFGQVFTLGAFVFVVTGYENDHYVCYSPSVEGQLVEIRARKEFLDVAFAQPAQGGPTEEMPG